MDLGFPCSFQLVKIANGLVAAFDAYPEGSPEQHLINSCIVKEAGLVLLLSEMYLLSFE